MLRNYCLAMRRKILGNGPLMSFICHPKKVRVQNFFNKVKL